MHIPSGPPRTATDDRTFCGHHFPNGNSRSLPTSGRRLGFAQNHMKEVRAAAAPRRPPRTEIGPQQAPANTKDLPSRLARVVETADKILDRELSTNEELREFERKVREYGEAVDEAMEREETTVEAMIKDAMRIMQEEESKGADLSS